MSVVRGSWLVARGFFGPSKFRGKPRRSPHFASNFRRNRVSADLSSIFSPSPKFLSIPQLSRDLIFASRHLDNSLNPSSFLHPITGLTHSSSTGKLYFNQLDNCPKFADQDHPGIPTSGTGPRMVSADHSLKKYLMHIC